MTGSCALNLCGVACGRLDIFYELGYGGPWYSSDRLYTFEAYYVYILMLVSWIGMLLLEWLLFKRQAGRSSVRKLHHAISLQTAEKSALISIQS